MREKLTGRGPTFRRASQSNSYILILLVVLIMIALFALRGVATREIVSPFEPTPAPTRTSDSYAQEGETLFEAGNLNGAIEAYKKALELNPSNVEFYSELARIQVYSSAVLTTDTERKVRLQEALDVINQGVALGPDNSTVHAIRAFVLDWNANPVLAGDQSEALLLEAEQEATTALQLDNQNTLALAFFAEILNDQSKWLTAEEYIQQAVQLDPGLMDVHRIYAVIRETLQDYEGAIEEYKLAAEIMPNYTYLYLAIGVTYRSIGNKQVTDAAALPYFETALEYFGKAVTINERLGVHDPAPYLAIGKTYSQMGEFFAAALNVKKTLELNPNNPEIYGTLGVIYFKARNYETSIEVLKCAVEGCTAEESCAITECNTETDHPQAIAPLELNYNTVVYYYTYGSVLAGMHQPGRPYCEQAVNVLAKIRNAYNADTTIMAIIEPSIEICASFGYETP